MTAGPASNAFIRAGPPATRWWCAVNVSPPSAVNWVSPRRSREPRPAQQRAITCRLMAPCARSADGCDARSLRLTRAMASPGRGGRAGIDQQADLHAAAGRERHRRQQIAVASVFTRRGACKHRRVRSRSAASSGRATSSVTPAATVGVPPVPTFAGFAGRSPFDQVGCRSGEQQVRPGAARTWGSGSIRSSR